MVKAPLQLPKIRLSVEVPPAVCEDCYKRVMNEFTKQSKDSFGSPIKEECSLLRWDQTHCCSYLYEKTLQNTPSVENLPNISNTSLQSSETFTLPTLIVIA